jgi:hypothetical protein
MGIRALLGGDLGFLLMILIVESILQIALWSGAQFFKIEPNLLE